MSTDPEPIPDDLWRGDAMRWTPAEVNPPGWPKPRPTRCPCPACTATKESA